MLWYSTLWIATPFSNGPLWLTLFVEGVNDRLLEHCQVSSVPYYCGFKEQEMPTIYTVWMRACLFFVLFPSHMDLDWRVKLYLFKTNDKDSLYRNFNHLINCILIYFLKNVFHAIEPSAWFIETIFPKMTILLSFPHLLVVTNLYDFFFFGNVSLFPPSIHWKSLCTKNN